MTLILLLIASIGGAVAVDMNFNENKAAGCSDVRMIDATATERKYCLAQGKIEQGTKEVAEARAEAKATIDLVGE